MGCAQEANKSSSPAAFRGARCIVPPSGSHGSGYVWLAVYQISPLRIIDSAFAGRTAAYDYVYWGSHRNTFRSLLFLACSVANAGLLGRSKPRNCYRWRTPPAEQAGWGREGRREHEVRARIALLRSKPVQISLDLNQWVRFDQPGVYTLNVSSRRVLPVNNSGNAQFTLASNVIELRIIPANPEWQAAALNAILQHLSTRGPEFESAAADLRYLATPAAIEEMTSRLREGYAFIATECSYGLLGVPDSMRDLAIASMNKRIEEPDFPISQLLFTTMSLLHVTSGSTAESINAQRQAFDPLLWQTVFSSVPRKKGTARAETLQTLLTFGRYIDTPSLKSQMTQLLSASFMDLDAPSQIDDLRRNWDVLRSPEILPALQTLAKLTATNDGEFDPVRENLKAVAFRRWYELDPAGAQREIFHEIGSDEPPLSSQALAFLPAEPLPQFESLWAQVFVGTTDQGREKVLGSLLVHFGTGAAISQMIAKLNEPPRPNSCTSHSLALAYLVRFSPGEARLLLKRDLTTDEAACDAHLFQYISEHATAPLLNDVATRNAS